MKKVLTIAGSDSSGGAGVQADLKTMLANGVYGMSAITALTAQNTQGVRMVQEATPEFLAAELDAVFEDIRPDAVKIGMVASPALIHVIAEKLQGYGAEHVVVDPVMVATSGAKLLADDAVEVLVYHLIESLPDGKRSTLSAPLTFDRVFFKAGHRRKTALRKTEYLSHRIFVRRSRQHISALRAADGFQYIGFTQNRNDLL